MKVRIEGEVMGYQRYRQLLPNQVTALLFVAVFNGTPSSPSNMHRSLS